MVLLNPFSKYFLLLCLCPLIVWAEVLTFFDPSHASSSKVSFSYFLANDAISLSEFIGDWKSHYHPKSGENIALQDLSVELGKQLESGYYVGIFHRYDVFISADKDFADFYYTVKNKKPLLSDRVYGMDLDIYGLRASGLRLAKGIELYRHKQEVIMIGVGVQVLFGHDMQEGDIRGSGLSRGDKSYHIEANSHYNYTQNYLYDLDVDKANGLGYGMDFALSYSNSEYGFFVSFVANDLLGKLYWKDLPYSEVTIETNNKSNDTEGYATYAPSIYGVEKYHDISQDIEPRYRLKFSQKLSEKGLLSVGVSHAYAENFPFIRWDEALDALQDVGISYEGRFHSVGLDYRYKGFSCGLMADSLRDFSSFGLHASWQVKLN